jgi:hypothetical protein
MHLYENNIWQCAIEMLKSHGTSAHIEARRRADELGISGNVPAFDAWRRIETAIETLMFYDKTSPVSRH